MNQTLVLEDFPPRVPLRNGKVLDVARTLSPNGRAHWRVKVTAKQAVAERVAVRALIQHLQPMLGYVVMQPTFIYPVQRKRDDDNLATGLMKVVRDALVQAGYLEADDMQHLEQLRPEVLIQKKRRALILEFRLTRAPVSAPISSELVASQGLHPEHEHGLPARQMSHQDSGQVQE